MGSEMGQGVSPFRCGNQAYYIFPGMAYHIADGVDLLCLILVVVSCLADAFERGVSSSCTWYLTAVHFMSYDGNPTAALLDESRAVL